MKERTETTLENLEKAMVSLHEYLKDPIITNRDRAGVIQGFEFCYELFWKAFKKIAEDHGKTPGSPKQAFSEALQIGLITPEEELLWIQIMKDRNLASHTYNQALAKGLCEKIAQHHIKLFKSTLTRIQKFMAIKN